MSEIKPYGHSARRDLRWWMLLLVGSGMFYAGLIVDPAKNCDESGRECAPWLVPVAMVIGGVFGLLGAARLITNPRQGSRIDPATGDLVWWQERFGRDGGKEGRIHPSQIGRISIVSQSDDMDEVHLYDLAGERQAYFDGEVIPSPFEGWAKTLAEKYPHIQVDVR
jgi:hypothetical protein